MDTRLVSATLAGRARPLLHAESLSHFWTDYRAKKEHYGPMPPKREAKQSFNVQVYMDIRTLATLIQFSKEQNFHANNTYSSLLRDLLDRFAATLTAHGKAKDVTTVTEAIQVLQSYGLTVHQSHTATQTARIKQLELEDNVLEAIVTKPVDENAYNLLMGALGAPTNANVSPATVSVADVRATDSELA